DLSCAQDPPARALRYRRGPRLHARARPGAPRETRAIQGGGRAGPLDRRRRDQALIGYDLGSAAAICGGPTERNYRMRACAKKHAHTPLRFLLANWTRSEP